MKQSNDVVTALNAEVHEARHLLGHYGYEGGYHGGSFSTKLIELLEVADGSNQIKLLTAYPAMRTPVWIMQNQGGTALQEWVVAAEFALGNLKEK